MAAHKIVTHLTLPFILTDIELKRRVNAIIKIANGLFWQSASGASNLINAINIHQEFLKHNILALLSLMIHIAF